MPMMADARHPGASVTLNSAELGQVTRDDHTVRGLDQSAVIDPGERLTVIDAEGQWDTDTDTDTVDSRL